MGTAPPTALLTPYLGERQAARVLLEYLSASKIVTNLNILGGWTQETCLYHLPCRTCPFSSSMRRPVLGLGIFLKNGGHPCWKLSSLPLHCTSALAMSIPIPLAPAAIRFRSPARKGSARFRKLRNSIRNSQLPVRKVLANPRRTRHPGFQQYQLKNARSLRNGSDCLPSRAVSVPAISQPMNLNGGRT